MHRNNEEKEFFIRLNQYKKIAAVKSPKGIEKVIKHKDRISAVFLLTGNIMSIKRYVDLFKKEGLPVFVHIEKIGGLSMNDEGIDFIANYVQPLGIVSTKPNMVAKAKKRKLMAVQRVFMIDTEVYDYVLHSLDQNTPDIIEIMPSRLSHVIRDLSKQLKIPLITGGLLSEKAHAMEVLACGAIAITTSNTDIWKEDL
ncbi:glycerol-3-phosphate responsive antiterminator [Cytobacillus depressus]|uniref:Glycerol uptake operon antiterminator regulatory protein n=1 Tax=Cytobacillus depressus TaxID=1602942 RepID=A0A6L3V6X3_9BACI|nr:glycerol-3-phosphate responsive antiterminator [Cytobacillus depressus]KAB2332152.1 glycerol-3-phosphate responsive antiterminator [Cytobacillus depressus]